MMSRLVYASIPVLLLAAACGKSDCEKLYDISMKCDKGDKKSKLDMDKDSFIGICKLMAADSKGKDELADAMDCANKAGDSCEELEKCQKAQSGKKRAKRYEKDLEDGKVSNVISSCQYSSPEELKDEAFKATCVKAFGMADKLSDKDIESVGYRCRGDSKNYKELVAAMPEFAKLCSSIATKQFTSAAAKATEARDAGKNDYTVCSNYKESAKTLDGGKEGEKFKVASAACTEMEVADEVAKGVKEAKANAAAKKPDSPYQCRTTVEKLQTLQSDWGKKQLDTLLKACYVELGAVVIDTEMEKKPSYCPYAMKQIFEADAKYGLSAKFPELAEAEKKVTGVDCK